MVDNARDKHSGQRNCNNRNKARDRHREENRFYEGDNARKRHEGEHNIIREIMLDSSTDGRAGVLS